MNAPARNASPRPREFETDATPLDLLLSYAYEREGQALGMASVFRDALTYSASQRGDRFMTDASCGLRPPPVPCPCSASLDNTKIGATGSGCQA
jgi:hypothetical protein